MNDKLIIRNKLTQGIICEVENIDGFYGLSDANLSGADLSGANLSGANLTCADLTSADLSYADLTCADLTSADLTRAYLTKYHDGKWSAYIQIDNIRIGCKYFTVTEWRNFTNDDIKAMDKNALEYWERNKAIIFAIHQNLVGEKAKNGK